MIFSRSLRYTLQALVSLAAEPAGTPVMGRALAERLHVPAAYLCKLLQRLAQAGVLESSRGPQGGFRLTAAGRRLSLMELVLLINGEQATRECVLGFKTCADETACALHRHWRPVKEQLFELLASQSVGELAEAVKTGRCRLEDLNALPLPPARP